MKQGNGSKCVVHLTAAMFRLHHSESLRGALLMSLIFLEMSQNSQWLFLPPKTVVFKQAPSRPAVVPVFYAELR